MYIGWLETLLVNVAYKWCYLQMLIYVVIMLHIHASNKMLLINAAYKMLLIKVTVVFDGFIMCEEVKDSGIY